MATLTDTRVAGVGPLVKISGGQKVLEHRLECWLPKAFFDGLGAQTMNIRRLIICVAMAAFLSTVQAADDKVVRLSEPVAVTDEAEIFGALLNEDASPTALGAILERPDEFVGSAVRVEARISQVCQRKGCFMIATSGEDAIRISFKDYGFFVPTDTGGKIVTFTGTVVTRELSEEQAAHLREDAGSDVIAAGPVYEIVADAVSVPKS